MNTFLLLTSEPTCRTSGNVLVHACKISMQAVIPRSRSAEHMVDNLAVAQASSLSESDMKVLGVLDGTLRI
jgi:diketogulonate reductase-like aldo/keto reductase